MALHTDAATERAGFTRRADHPPVCPDCGRVLVRVEQVRGVCPACGQLVTVTRWLLAAFAPPREVPPPPPPAEVDVAVFDVTRRGHLPTPGPGQAALF